MGLPFHPIWLVLVLAIVLIIFGPGKLPELGGAVGRGIREFRKASSEITDEVKSSMNRSEPAPTPPTTATNAAPSTATGATADDSAEPEASKTGKS
jgi:TatA/E family protein of Tat protein translocase